MEVWFLPEIHHMILSMFSIRQVFRMRRVSGWWRHIIDTKMGFPKFLSATKCELRPYCVEGDEKFAHVFPRCRMSLGEGKPHALLCWDSSQNAFVQFSPSTGKQILLCNNIPWRLPNTDWARDEMRSYRCLRTLTKQRLWLVDLASKEKMLCDTGMFDGIVLALNMEMRCFGLRLEEIAEEFQDVPESLLLVEPTTAFRRRIDAPSDTGYLNCRPTECYRYQHKLGISFYDRTRNAGCIYLVSLVDSSQAIKKIDLGHISSWYFIYGTQYLCFQRDSDPTPSGSVSAVFECVDLLSEERIFIDSSLYHTYLPKEVILRERFLIRFVLMKHSASDDFYYTLLIYDLKDKGAFLRAFPTQLGQGGIRSHEDFFFDGKDLYVVTTVPGSGLSASPSPKLSDLKQFVFTY